MECVTPDAFSTTHTELLNNESWENVSAQKNLILVKDNETYSKFRLKIQNRDFIMIDYKQLVNFNPKELFKYKFLKTKFD